MDDQRRKHESYPVLRLRRGVAPRLFPLGGWFHGQLLKQSGIIFLQASDAVKVVCGNPRQPEPVPADTAPRPTRPHSPTFLLPPDAFQVVLASRKRNHRLRVMQQNPGHIKVVLVLRVVVQLRVGAPLGKIKTPKGVAEAAPFPETPV